VQVGDKIIKVNNETIAGKNIASDEIKRKYGRRWHGCKDHCIEKNEQKISITRTIPSRQLMLLTCLIKKQGT
jgi:hypothetical protein